MISGAFTTFPPLLPVLGRDGSLAGSPTLTRVATFPYFCEFWQIAHEVGAFYYSSPGPLHLHVPLAYAESKFRRLLQWSENLPAHLARSESMPHNVAEMQ